MTPIRALPPAFAALAVPLSLLAAAPAARAASQEALQGAWVLESGKCEDVFARRGGKIVFRKNSDLALPGFIVEGNRIRGLTATCTVASVKEKGDGLAVLLDCSSRLMFGRMSVTVRISAPDTLERSEPSFPEIAETYHRCTLP
jgi:hypothetical protein